MAKLLQNRSVSKYHVSVILFYFAGLRETRHC